MAQQNRKVVHLCVSQLNDHLYSSLYFESFLEKGIAVEFWDLSCALGYPENYVLSKYKEFVKCFSSEDECLRQIRRLVPEATVLNLQFFYGQRIEQFAREVLELGYVTSYFDFDNFPRNSVLREFLASLKASVFPYFLSVDFVFRTGGYSPVKFRKRAKILPLNHPYFDDFRVQVHPAKEKICVFIDQSLPSHPDFELIGTGENNIDFQDYYDGVAMFLREIERSFGYVSLIAAHPKNEELGENYKGIEVVKGRTNEVLKKSSLAIAHSSTAISTAVLYRTPLIFATSNVVKNSIQGEYVESQTMKFAKFLNVEMVNIDETRELSRFDFPSERYMKKYEDYFLTSSQSRGSSSSELMSRYIDEIFEKCGPST